jgi:hypothetical protein
MSEESVNGFVKGSITKKAYQQKLILYFPKIFDSSWWIGFINPLSRCLNSKRVAVKLAVLMADCVDQLALPVNFRGISLSYFVNLYTEAPVLMDLHGVSQPSWGYLDLKFYPGQ